jgi:hypothetical protein
MKGRWLTQIAGWLTILGTTVCGAATSPMRQPSSSPLPQTDLIDKYCIACHNDRTKIAGLALNTLNIEEVGENAQVWEKVVRKLSGRAMPPAGRPRPDETEYDELVSYLGTSLDRTAAAKPNPGRTDAFRRLSRTEYQNAIRDLIGLEIDVTALLPKDDSSHGFDNVTVGELSPTCWSDT